MAITPATAVALNQLQVQNELAARVLRKTLDVSAEQGAQLAQLVAQQAGVGQRIDLYA